MDEVEYILNGTARLGLNIGILLLEQKEYRIRSYDFKVKKSRKQKNRKKSERYINKFGTRQHPNAIFSKEVNKVIRTKRGS